MTDVWKARIDELKEKRKLILEAGGSERIYKQHKKGKLLARERLETLFDDGIFFEIDDMVSSRACESGIGKRHFLGDGVVTGYGYIHGRITFAAAQDFTINGGTLGEAHALKICHIMDKAVENRAPFIAINDGGGARIEEGIDSLSGYAKIFYRNTYASGVIPQISVVLGPCAGGACYSPAISDFVFMTAENGQMYITGPQVVKAVIGEDISAIELGGAAVHQSISGVAHFVYDNDVQCLNGVRKLLSYLPQNNMDKPLYMKGIMIDKCSKLTQIVPANFKYGYDIHEVIYSFVDYDSFFEVQENFACNIVIGFARLDGKTVGIIANQSRYLAGSLEINASDKAARFIRFCDCFGIPLVSLIDVPAFLPGREQEHGGIIRHGAKLLYAYAEATVPKISLIMRKAYGGAYIAMNSKGIGADIVYAWPIAQIAVMGAEAAVSIVGRKKVEVALDQSLERQHLIDEYNQLFMNPYIAAEHGYVDEVILPEETRNKIISALKMLENKQKNLPYKKHGNIPL